MAKKEKKSGKKKLLIALSLILVVAIATSTVVFVKYKDMITPPAEVPQDTNVYDFDEDETVPETLAEARSAALDIHSYINESRR